GRRPARPAGRRARTRPLPRGGRRRGPRYRATRCRADSSRRSPRKPRNGSSSSLPAPEELRPVRSVEGFEVGTERPYLGLVLVLRPEPTKELEAAVDEIGVRDVGLAVVADLGQASLPIGVPYLRAVHAELAGEAAEACEVVEARARPGRVQGEEVHQVEMPGVITTEIVVPAELLPRVAGLPEARGAHPVDERPVVQHLQVEAAPVPGHQLRR